jgi:ATP-binding cassette subfamily B (MDR/TAP) protein 10
MAFFDRSRTGELVNRLSNDATMVGYSVSMNISDGLRALVNMVGSGCMMVAYMLLPYANFCSQFYVAPQLSVVGVSIVPVVAAMAIVYGRYVRKITKAMNNSLAASTQVRGRGSLRFFN